MKQLCGICFFFCHFLSSSADTRSDVNIRIVDKENKQALNSVVCIYNDTVLIPIVENLFIINLKDKDTLIFKQVGYGAHTLVVDSQMLDQAITVSLEVISHILPEVSVFGGYQLTPQMIANARHNVRVAVYQASQIDLLSVMDDPAGYHLENLINSRLHHGIPSSQTFSFSTKYLKSLRTKKPKLPQNRIISLEEYKSEELNK